MGIYEGMLQKIASDTMNWKGRVPGFGAAPTPAPVSAPVVAPGMEVGPVSPQAGKYQAGRALASRAYNMSPWLKSIPGVALATEGIGRALTGEGDTWQNLTRGVVGGAGIMGGIRAFGALGGVPGRALAAGTLAGEGIASGLDAAFEPGKSDILNPQFAKTVEAAGGVTAYNKGLGAKPVAASPDVTMDGVTYTPQALQAMQAALKGPSDWGSFPNANPAPVAAPAVPVAPAASEYIMPTPGYGGGMLGGFVQGAMGMKYNAGVEARKLAGKKLDMTAQQLLLDQMTKGATMQETNLKSAAWAERLWLAGMETDPAKRVSYIGGPALPAPPAAQVPLGIQPMTQDQKNPVVNMWDPVSHTAQSIPIRPVQRVATISEAIADAKRNGKYTSPQQVRRDAEKLGVRITD